MTTAADDPEKVLNQLLDSDDDIDPELALDLMLQITAKYEDEFERELQARGDTNASS